MNDNDFCKQVQRVSRILYTMSMDSDTITPEALDHASIALLNEEGLNNNDRYLIAHAAKQLAESMFEPIDDCTTNKCRGSVYFHGIRKQVVDAAKGEC